jgi:hypothetical protein
MPVEGILERVREVISTPNAPSSPLYSLGVKAGQHVHQGPTIRQQNDSLVSTVRELGIRDDAPFVFMCECRDAFCNDYVKLTIAEYASHRSERTPILSAGHLASHADGRAS